jgi:hypothetical protein
VRGSPPQASHHLVRLNLRSPYWTSLEPTATSTGSKKSRRYWLVRGRCPNRSPSSARKASSLSALTSSMFARPEAAGAALRIGQGRPRAHAPQRPCCDALVGKRARDIAAGRRESLAPGGRVQNQYESSCACGQLTAACGLRIGTTRWVGASPLSFCRLGSSCAAKTRPLRAGLIILKSRSQGAPRAMQPTRLFL